MTNKNSAQSDNGIMPVQRHRIDSLELYDVTEDELNALEKGTSTNTKLTISVALLSIGCTFGVSLLSTTIESLVTLVLISSSTVFGIGIGIVLWVIWWNGDRKAVGEVVTRIKARKNPEVVDTVDSSAIRVKD